MQPFTVQTKIIHSLKYLRSMTLFSKDNGIISYFSYIFSTTKHEILLRSLDPPNQSRLFNLLSVMKVMKVSFVLNDGLYSNRESGGFLENATMIQIQEMFENGKPDIVLKTFKSFNIKTNPFIILISEKSFKLWIYVLVMLSKMLLLVFTIDFFSRFGPGS